MVGDEGKAEGEGRRWDDEVDADGYPISEGARRAVEALDETWSKRYVKFAKRTNWILAGLGVGVTVALCAQYFVIRENNTDSHRQDEAIVTAQRENCAGFGQFRDAVVTIFLRAFASQDPPSAQALAVHIKLNAKARASLPSKPAPQNRHLTREQRRVGEEFFTTAILGLHHLTCHVSKRT